MIPLYLPMLFSLATDESTCDVDTSETAPAVLAVSVTVSVLVVTSALADAELSEETVDFISVPTAASTALTKLFLHDLLGLPELLKSLFDQLYLTQLLVY